MSTLLKVIIKKSNKIKMSLRETTEIEILRNANTFELWKFQIDILLQAKGLYDVIIEEEPESDNEDFDKFKENDAKAKGIIVMTVDKRLQIHIMCCKSAKGMYEKLCALFNQETELQKQTLLQDFFNFKMNGTMSISENASRLENLRFKLINLKQNVDEEMMIGKFLSVLPEVYNFSYQLGNLHK